jgi:hypothetical protein
MLIELNKGEWLRAEDVRHIEADDGNLVYVEFERRFVRAIVEVSSGDDPAEEMAKRIADAVNLAIGTAGHNELSALRERVAALENAISPAAVVVDRVPWRERKSALVEFLRDGPKSRKAILAGTDIPEGSLSSLLVESDFKQVERGLWALAEKTP